MGDWYRVPAWVYTVHDPHTHAIAAAWVYLLGAWHAGRCPTVREVRRVTGFGGGRADRLCAEVAAWAADNGAVMPAKLNMRSVPGQYRGSSGAVPGQSDAGTTGNIRTERGSTGAVPGQYRGASRARVPYSEEIETKKDTNCNLPPEGPPPAAPVGQLTRRPTVRREPAQAPPIDPGTHQTPTDQPAAQPGASSAQREPSDSTPSWVPPARDVAPMTRGAALAAILDAIEAITHTRPPAARAKTAAAPILTLWRSLGRPPLDELVNDVRTVAEWARTSPDAAAARDIRAVGWEGGVDRSQSVATITVQRRWDERLAAAKTWVARGRPTSGLPTVGAAGRTRPESEMARLQRLMMERGYTEPDEEDRTNGPH